LKRKLKPGEVVEVALLKTTYTRDSARPENATVYPVPDEYVSAIHEAQVRVRVIRQQLAHADVVIHGVTIELAGGQPVAVVRKRIVAPFDGGAVTIQAQGLPLPRPPRKIRPVVEIGAISVPAFVWLGPKLEDFGLSEMQFGPQTIRAMNPHGPPQAKAMDPIRIHLTYLKPIPVEEFTVTVPVHR
jgi:hypothetical protein